MVVKFGMRWKDIGIGVLEIPDEFHDKSDEEIKHYIIEHWNEVKIPVMGDVIDNSDTPDFEHFFSRGKK